MASLVLVRHGETEWNVRGLWQGLTDIALTEVGRAEARRAGDAIRDLSLDVGFTSTLQRARATMEEIQSRLSRPIPVIETPLLNERDLGVLTGQTHASVRAAYGEAQFLEWQQGWDCPIPGGQTLREVALRVGPFFEAEILARLIEGHGVLIAAHRGTLRALIVHLERLPISSVQGLDMATGETYVYEIDAGGAIVGKEIRATAPHAP